MGYVAIQWFEFWRYFVMRMYKVFALIGVMGVCMASNTSIYADSGLATTAYSSSGGSASVTETTTISVSYDDSGGAKYRWRVQDWCLTIDEVFNYSIPDTVPVLTKCTVNSDKSNFVLDSNEVFDYAIVNDVVPDYDTGEVVVYAQPVLCVEEFSDGQWSVTDKDIRSLEVWKSVKDWKGISRFRSLYNLEVRVRVPGEKSCIRKDFRSGGSLASNTTVCQAGTVKTLKGLGVKETISNDSKINTLCGVEVSNAIGTDGKEYNGKAFLDLESVSNGAYHLTTDSSLIDVNGHSVLFAQKGFVLGNKRSELYDVIADAEFRLGYNTSITAWYVREFNEYSIVYRQQFYNGADAELDVSVVDCTNDKSLEDSISVKSLLNQHGIQSTVWHNGCNKWQLDGLQFAKSGESTAGDLGEPVGYNHGKSINLGVVKSSNSDWASKCSIANEQTLQLQKLGGDWVVQGDYVVYAPQVELSYFRDSSGELHLFSTTSGGKDFDSLDGMKRSLYGKDSSVYGFSRVLENQSVAGTNRDLVLTKAYAYSGPACNAVDGYLSDERNCWTDSTLPSGGKSVLAAINDKSAISWDCNKEDALKEAYSDGSIGTVTIGVSRVPINPLIYVAVYEEAPAVHCVSYVTVSDSITDSTMLTKQYERPTVVQYGGEEYSGSEKVSVACGTEALEAYRVYSQDGIDDGITASGISSIDDLRGYVTLAGGDRVYCTRYAWVTGDAVNSILALGDNTTIGSIKNLTGGRLEDSTISGNFYLEDGKGILVKIFTPEVKADRNAWKVNYLDLENGAESTNFSSFKDEYSRLQRAQLVGDYRVVIENSTTDGGYLKNVSVTVDGIERKLELTNVGTSTATKSYTVDEGSGTGGGYTNAYNSAVADSEYATEKKKQLEHSGTWMINPYSAGDYNALSTNGFNGWLGSKASYTADAVGWQWYVYKYAKACSIATVYEGSDENQDSFYTASGYSKKQLSPYTSEYSIGCEPFKEDYRTGDVYFLDGIYWGYVDEESSVITQTELDKLKASVSFCHGYSGGYSKCDLSKSSNGTGFSSSIDGNSISVGVDGEQLHVVAVYKKFQTEEPVQDNPVTTQETISFRDTGELSANGTSVWVSSASSNDNGVLELDARFRGAISNDVDNSSDDYVAATAIPTTEFVRTTAIVPEYLADLDFVKNSVSVGYQFEFYQGVSKGTESTDVYGNSVVSFDGYCEEYRPSVQRSGVNYSLKGATVWYPEDTTIKNYCLPESLKQRITMVGTNETWVNDKFGVSTVEDAQFFFKNFKVGDDLEAMCISLGVHSSPVAVDGCSDDAESRVSGILATNQQVNFEDGNGIKTELLKHSEPDVFVDEPVDAPAARRVAYDKVYGKGDSKTGVFSSKNDNSVLPWGATQGNTKEMCIDKKKDNGIYESKGYVRFVTKPSLIEQHGIVYKDAYGKEHSAVDNGIVYPLGINDVKILTPAVVTFSITDEHEWDQIIATSVGYPLVLDRVFTLSTSAIGSHCGLPGYGTKNYVRYLADMSNTGKKAIRVRFPFVVVKVSENSQGNLEYNAVRAGQWVTIGLGSSNFLLPTFVEEGDLQRIEIRAYACNITRSNQMNQCEYGMNANRQQLKDYSKKNTDDGWNYVAYRDLMTGVIGRVYGLSVIDVGDYPLWQGVFRDEDQELTGFEFYSGLANRDGLFRGNLSNGCFPLVDGDNPKYTNEGFSKLGYVTKFKLETIGSMYSADDVVEIIPEFYWVDEEGKNRTKVELYYDTSIGGVMHQGVKIGSDLEKGTVNKLCFANGKYGVSLDRLERTADLLGYSSTQQFTTHESPVYSFSKIQLNQYTRNFVGDLHNSDVRAESVLINKMIEVDGASLNVPTGVIDRSVQQWYGDYYLPVGLHVTEYDEETVRDRCPMYQYNEKTVDGKSIWKEDGYLIVNFTIRAVNNQKYSLAYDATEYEEMSNAQHYDAGHCDAWEDELRPAVKKSSNGVTFVLENGDFLVYDVKDFGKDDAGSNYNGGGTH